MSFLQQEKSLSIIDAELLEDSCAEITDAELCGNGKSLEEKIVAEHPELILNVDETGLDYKRDTQKLKIVSASPCLQVYLSLR